MLDQSKHPKENTTEYAKTVDGKELHISQISKEGSGRKGYFCIGCDREMQAVIPEKKVKSYFRHDAKDVRNKGKCTFSNETYRHKIAKEILQRIKQVKVPTLYKYPPKFSDEKPNFIRESRFIVAHSVGIERVFFEDEEGVIRWEKKQSATKRYLEFQPDVTFFDKSGKPILLIEIVATHKVDDEKKVKIRRVGIDTIQISIPKSSSEEIEETFYKTTRTKWIFNNEEASTNYLSISDRNSEEISSVDKLERKFLEESFSCRSSEIRNLIRSINRCLESKSYKGTEQAIRNELQRVERNTEKAREQWEGIQRELRNEVDREYREWRSRVEGEQEEFQKDYSELEARYLKTKREDSGEEEEIDKSIERIEDRIRWNNESSKRGRENFREEQNEIEEELGRIEKEKATITEQEEKIDEACRSEERIILQQIEFEEARFGREEERIAEEENGLSEEFRQRRNAVVKQIEERERAFQSKEADFPNKDGRRRESTINEIRERKEKIRNRRKEIRGKRKQIPRTKQEVKRAVEQRFRTLREQTARSIEERVCRRDGEFTREFNKVVKIRTLLDRYEEIKLEQDRISEANKCLRQGMHKKWN